MRKIILLLVFCFLIYFVSGCVNELSLVANVYPISVDGLNIWVNTLDSFAFAGTFFCDDYYDGIQLTIPDEYEGIPIIQLGGNTAVSKGDTFSIHLTNKFLNVPEDNPYFGVVYTELDSFVITDPYTVEDLVFVLYIGKNIKNIEGVSSDYYYPSFSDSGALFFYHPVLYIECSEENDTFYSENGVLFYKSTGKQVSEFDYAN